MDERIDPKPKIGELLVLEGLISEEQLNEAIALQSGSKTYVPLGEILVGQRLISRIELQQILKKNKRRLYLGELLVDAGYLDHDAVQKALEVQQIERKKLGAILVEHGYITEANLINLLSTQLGIPKILPSPGLIDPGILKGVSKAFLIKNECLPAFREGEIITVIMSDPLSEETIRTLEAVLKGKVEPAIASSTEIQTGIKRVFDDLRMLDIAEDRAAKVYSGQLSIGEAGTLDTVEENISSLLDFVISSAIADRATDIHIEPLENMLRVRYRVDGVLKHKTDLPISLGSTLVSRIKAICRMDIDDRRKHQDGRLEVQAFNRRYDLRVATYSSFNGESIAIRLLPNQSNLLDLDMLGLSPSNLHVLKQILSIPAGIIMATGPNGAGKSTTVYASLRFLNSMDKKIVTIEDPIEYKIDGVIQGQLHEKSGLGYKHFLRSILRQDPDVVMIGEIRDKISAEAVIEMALSGHKIITTFHTEDTVGALLRMFGIGVESFLISSTLMAVISQRLVRVLCPLCKVRYEPAEEVLALFDSIKPIDTGVHEFYTSSGCIKCDNTGFKGRTAICELLILNDPIRDAIMNKMPYPTVRSIARESTGFVSLKEDGFYKAVKGTTSLEEVLRVVPYNESDALLTRPSTKIVELCERGYAMA
ncbi:MAG: Flp pilus assembly complex ATPase component TadA [Deltaproteobacteria bacterium]|nr:Flp pilus assembly complex ATPase component TadA [Deltaproteobacteria bacterium]